jgi:signal peptidase II
MSWNTKSWRFWPLLVTVLIADCASKRAVEARLQPGGPPRPVAGEVVRVRLGYNRDAAFGIPVGNGSRWLLPALAGAAVVALVLVYRRAAPRNVMLITGLALVVGGALGNLLDRLRSPLGVVDWIDIGIGNTRFWTFNVADLAITIGACCLILSLLRAGDEAPAP